MNGEFVVTWLDVPRYADPGSTQTFQAILSPRARSVPVRRFGRGRRNNCTVGIQTRRARSGSYGELQPGVRARQFAVRIVPLRQWLTVTPAAGFLDPGAEVKLRARMTRRRSRPARTRAPSTCAERSRHAGRGRRRDAADTGRARRALRSGHRSTSATYRARRTRCRSTSPTTAWTRCTCCGSASKRRSARVRAAHAARARRSCSRSCAARARAARMSSGSRSRDDPDMGLVRVVLRAKAPLPVARFSADLGAARHGQRSRRRGARPHAAAAPAQRRWLAAALARGTRNVGTGGDRRPVPMLEPGASGPVGRTRAAIAGSTATRRAGRCSRAGDRGRGHAALRQRRRLDAHGHPQLPFDFPFYGGVYRSVNVHERLAVVHEPHEYVPRRRAARHGGRHAARDDRRGGTTSTCARRRAWVARTPTTTARASSSSARRRGALRGRRTVHVPGDPLAERGDRLQYLALASPANRATVGTRTGGTRGVTLAHDAAWARGTAREVPAAARVALGRARQRRQIEPGGEDTLRVGMSARGYADGEYANLLQLLQRRRRPPRVVVPARMRVSRTPVGRAVCRPPPLPARFAHTSRCASPARPEWGSRNLAPAATLGGFRPRTPVVDAPGA